MDYSFVTKIRWVGVAFIWAGFIFKAWMCWGFGMLVWLGTYAYTYSLIERAFFDMVSQKKREENGEKE